MFGNTRFAKSTESRLANKAGSCVPGAVADAPVVFPTAPDAGNNGEPADALRVSA
jgi:hypothetical protein